MRDRNLYSVHEMHIRIEIRELPGARQCPYCLVITQGGREGFTAHMQTCHPDITCDAGKAPAADSRCRVARPARTTPPAPETVPHMLGAEAPP